jgi:hypothetical protein
MVLASSRGYAWHGGVSLGAVLNIKWSLNLPVRPTCSNSCGN